MAHQFTTDYVADSIALFHYYKKLAERAMDQVSDDDFFRQIDPESNSVAIIVKHMAGNMRSRWVDFLTSDGEKPDRDRDSEFIQHGAPRSEYMRRWEEGWGHVFYALENLTNSDVFTRVTIRGEPHSVMQAINRQVAHYAHHIGQIVFLCKHLRGAQWKNLSVPRGQSKQFSADVATGRKSQR
jgi:hypothetical protein